MTLQEFMSIESLEGCTASEIRLVRSCLASSADKDRLVSKLVSLERKKELSSIERAARAELSLNEYKTMVKVLTAIGYVPDTRISLLDYDKPKAKELFFTGLMSIHKIAQELRCDPRSILEYLDSEGLKVKRGDAYMSVWYPLNMYRMMTKTDVREISKTMGSSITRLVDKLPTVNKEAVLRYFRDLEPVENFSQEEMYNLDYGVALIKKTLGMGISVNLRFRDANSREQYERYSKVVKEAAISIPAFQDMNCLSVNAVGLSRNLALKLSQGGVRYIMDIDKVKACKLDRKERVEFNQVLRKYGLLK